jgi:peptide deformylase
MAVLPIFVYGHKALRKRAQAVNEINPELVKLANDMLETMYNAPGIGLAAPQVGRSMRLVVADVKNYEEGEKEPYILFNPEIIDFKGKCTDEEGCLSFPGITVNVTRPEFVTIFALDEKGETLVLKNIGGLLSRCLQHEIDHLEGVLLSDKMSSADKLLLSGKLKKLAKEKRLT